MATAAPKAGIDIGRVISKGFAALAKNAIPYLGLSLLLAGIPAFFMQQWMMSVTLAPPDPAAMFSGSFWMPLMLSTLVGIVSGALLQGIVVRSSILQLSGRPADVGGSVVAALSMVLPIIGLSILIGLISIFGLLLLIVPGVIFYLMFIVAVPVLVSERKGVIESLGRSAALTSGSKLLIFLLVVIFLIFAAIVSTVIGLFGAVSIAIVGPGATASALSGAVVETITRAVAATMVASLYVELMTIKEGATTDGLAEVFA